MEVESKANVSLSSSPTSLFCSIKPSCRAEKYFSICCFLIFLKILPIEDGCKGAPHGRRVASAKVGYLEILLSWLRIMKYAIDKTFR